MLQLSVTVVLTASVSEVGSSALDIEVDASRCALADYASDPYGLGTKSHKQNCHIDHELAEDEFSGSSRQQ